MRAVTRDGSALKFASREVRNDQDVVMAAVTQDGTALQYAEEEVRCNLAVVSAAVRQNGRALEFAAGPLQEDRNLMRTAVSFLRREKMATLTKHSVDKEQESSIPKMEALVDERARGALMMPHIVQTDFCGGGELKQI